MNEQIATILLIILLASFVQGFSGFGFALVSIPILSLFIDIKSAVSIAAMCGLIINIYLFSKLKNQIQFKDLKYLLISSIIGIPFGVLILSELDIKTAKVLLGISVIVFLIILRIPILKKIKINLYWELFLGFLSGLYGGAYNTNGPPVLLYFFSQNWSKEKFKAAITGFFLITSVVIVTGHLVSGITTKENLTTFLILSPFVVFSNIIGHKLFGKVSTELFNKILLFSLVVISLLLIFG